MECVVFTDPLDAAWQVPEQVSIRPERFGALLYHFGTRRLSFLKSRALFEVVRSLADHPTARDACVHAGVSDAELPAYRTALASLAASDMIRRVSSCGPRNRTSGERDANQPQARDQTEPSVPNATNTLNSGEAELL